MANLSFIMVFWLLFALIRFVWDRFGIDERRIGCVPCSDIKSITILCHVHIHILCSSCFISCVTLSLISILTRSSQWNFAVGILQSIMIHQTIHFIDVPHFGFIQHEINSIFWRRLQLLFVDVFKLLVDYISFSLFEIQLHWFLSKQIQNWRTPNRMPFILVLILLFSQS
jgi:hypothetical protein